MPAGSRLDRRPISRHISLIAAQRFQRTFILAEGIDVVGASICTNGLFTIDLVAPNLRGLFGKLK